VRILAVNVVGDGTPSAGFAATPATTPGAPTITGITPGLESLSVAFTPPAFNGGSAITDYKYSTNGVDWTSASKTTSPIEIGGLEGGTAYTVRILAVNAMGDGAASDPVTETALTPDPVVFSEGDLAADGSGLHSVDTILEAVNFSIDPARDGSSYTLNGIAFTGVAGGTSGGTYWTIGAIEDVDQNRAGGLTAADPAYELARDCWFSYDPITLEITGLTPGTVYRLQVVWSSDTTRTAQLTNDEVAGNTSDTKQYGEENNGPALITAVWTESGTSQSFTIENDGGAPQVAGFVIGEVPAAGTLFMFR